MQYTTKGKPRKYVSDWTAVVAGHNYQFNHQLGTENLITEILFSPNNGTTVHKLCNHNSSDGPSYGAGVFSIDVDNLNVNTFSDGVSVLWNNGVVTGQVAGWYKVIATAI